MNYEKENEKVLALKSVCLLEETDENAVAYEFTIEGCFKKLDENYGDKDILVGEIFSNWLNLEPVKTELEVSDFVDQIEDDVAVLRTMGKDNEIENILTPILLERKLPRNLQVEYSGLFVRSSPEEKQNRMQFLLHFLKHWKKAYIMRLHLYTEPCQTSPRRRGTRGAKRRPKKSMVTEEMRVEVSPSGKPFSTSSASHGAEY